MVNKRKAISALVATVLLILITVAVTGIIWAAIRPTIAKVEEFSDACVAASSVVIDSGSGYTCCHKDSKNLSIMVNVGGGDFELSKIQIIIKGEGETKEFEVSSGVKEGSRTYVTHYSGEIEEIAVAPIVKIGEREKVCGVTSRISEIKDCVNVPVGFPLEESGENGGVIEEEFVHLDSCTNITESGNYDLAKNIVNNSIVYCFWIFADNVLLDCKNYYIDGIDSSSTQLAAIYAKEKRNITIRNCNITNWWRGILIENSSKNKIENNIFKNNGWGIQMFFSKENEINNNFFSRTDMGNPGVSLYNSNSNILSNNIGEGFTMNTAFDIEKSSNNNTIRNNTLKNNLFGVVLSYSSINNLVIENNLSSNIFGIEIVGSNANNVSYNKIYNNKENALLIIYSNNSFIAENDLDNNGNGTRLLLSKNNIISKNKIHDNRGVGIFLDSSSFNNISSNTIDSNKVGIKLFSDPCSENIIKDNIISLNSQYGIEINWNWKFSGTMNNFIYNNLFNQSNNYYLETFGPNFWNTTKQAEINIIGGSNIGGNYWTNSSGGFSDNCDDTNNDGICDVPYNIVGQYLIDKDYLPLKKQ